MTFDVIVSYTAVFVSILWLSTFSNNICIYIYIRVLINLQFVDCK